MHHVTEILLALFLALGCVWLAVDLATKLRAPDETAAEPAPAPLPAPVAITPAPVAAPSPAPTAPARDSAVPAPHLAAIAAVVHHLFQGRARLAGVLPAGHTEPLHHVDWAREGRRDIFSSHRVR